MKTAVSSNNINTNAPIKTESSPEALQYPISNSSVRTEPACNVNKRPISLDLKSSLKKQRLVADSTDMQCTKPLTTPDLEKILHSLPTPQPGLVYQSKVGIVTSEQEAFGKGFEEALHSLHNSNKGTQNVTNSTLITSTVASGMSGGSFTYTNLEPFKPVPIKDEPQNNPASPVGPVSPIDMETQEKIKLERKRQRNRVAASKCRKRKLERISKLEDKVKILKNENTDLGSVVKNLKEHVAQLKQQVIEHIESGCSVQSVYNGSLLQTK